LNIITQAQKASDLLAEQNELNTMRPQHDKLQTVDFIFRKFQRKSLSSR
jgi:hypothetical protein